ncbi:tryptophan--tRNA ligase [Candidatus Halobeggiatoa sp. HSG11]|nr:tryptophan--tRNA ligase [Candidatus Halobeggiatoa sp. HSG11]
MNPSTSQSVLSGMRPTGKLHLGHLHGVLNNWIKLQHEYSCYFFVADWHALTTEYDNTEVIAQSVWEMIIDWLAVGINPGEATLFIQSKVPEHAELHLLMSMSTPLSWLERIPTYKDQQQKLQNKDLSTYGFLGYPLLQSADILVYKAGLVPVGEDQVAHVEFTRELARRFNHIYGKEANFEDKAKEAIRKMGKKNAKLYKNLRKSYQEQGDDEALNTAQALVGTQQNISLGDKKRLLGFLEGESKTILPEPEALLTKTAKMPGLDGQKMSKSYQNTISLREAPTSIEKKIRTMQTDPARVRRTDPGDPAKCPVWQFHQIYSTAEQKAWVQEGCHSAKIGCIECKQPIIDSVLAELAPIRERALHFIEEPESVRAIISEGCEKARDTARETLEEVRQVMGLMYR